METSLEVGGSKPYPMRSIGVKSLDISFDVVVLEVRTKNIE